MKSEQNSQLDLKNLIKMLKIFVAFGLFVIVATNHKNAHTRDYNSGIEGTDGSYHYSFETSNGISEQHVSKGAEIIGKSSYISPEGQTILLRYTADENGFHPQGDHLPTPPPVPDYILKSLEYIRTHSQDSPLVKVSTPLLQKVTTPLRTVPAVVNVIPTPLKKVPAVVKVVKTPWKKVQAVVKAVQKTQRTAPVPVRVVPTTLKTGPVKVIPTLNREAFLAPF